MHCACHLPHSRWREEETKDGETLRHVLPGASSYPPPIPPFFFTSRTTQLMWKDVLRYSSPQTSRDQFWWRRPRQKPPVFAFCKSYYFSDRDSAGTCCFPFLFLAKMKLTAGEGGKPSCGWKSDSPRLRTAAQKGRGSLVSLCSCRSNPGLSTSANFPWVK